MEREQLSLLEAGAVRLGLSLSARQLDLLSDYALLVAEWNTRVRLVGDASADVFVRRHLLDSLSCAAHCISAGYVGARSRVVDVGAGAGLPGIPIAVAAGCDVVLLEATKKKAAFLTEATRRLGMKNVQVEAVRAEEAGRSGLREAFDCAVVRAVSDLAVDLEYGLPLVRVGGRVVVQKGAPGEAEIARGGAAADILGGTTVEAIKLDVGEYVGGPRTLIICRKTRPTPAGYPRKSGIARKRPLGTASRGECGGSTG